MSDSHEPSITLPFKRSTKANEVAFNNALGWLLQAEPKFVSDFTQNIGLQIDTGRDYQVTVRGGSSATEKPDLMILGWTWNSKDCDWEKAAIALELKTSKSTTLTKQQRTGYRNSLSSYKSKTFVLIAPENYSYREALPPDTLFLSLEMLYNLLKRCAPNNSSRALVSEIWTAFFHESLKVETIRKALEGDSSAALHGILRNLQLLVSKTDGIIPGKLGSSRNRGNPYAGFYIYPDAFCNPNYCAWVGFLFEEEKEEVYFQIDFASPDTARAVEKLTPKKLEGEVFYWDGNHPSASWRATHLTRRSKVITTATLGQSGIMEVLGVIREHLGSASQSS